MVVTVNFTDIFLRMCDSGQDYYDWMPWDGVSSKLLISQSHEYVVHSNSVLMVNCVCWAAVSQLKGGERMCAVSMGGIT